MVWLVPCRVGMESCSGSTYWARMLQSHGQQVRIMPARIPVFLSLDRNRPSILHADQENAF
jgi:transposase